MAGALVEAGAACVNILPAVTSVYRWEGKLNEDSESLLVIKASADVVPKLEAVMRAKHTYDLPEWVRSTVHGAKLTHILRSAPQVVLDVDDALTSGKYKAWVLAQINRS